ncbi:MAG: S-adenosylmethionine:tRNA ribosyltransferase-isomerase [Ignavibacteria bacterium]|nr:S-adenosylmethionine:tRNA ribosyltransferase-isomerase [Ignavibacteria bacterium]
MDIYKQININDYNYELPKNYIAQFPLKERDKSRLLIYQRGNIMEDIFFNIDKYIPFNSLLIFNDTRVIKARLFFNKPTGAKIEIFCLEPEQGMEFLHTEFNAVGCSTWKCLVGKSGKWKHNVLEKEFQYNDKTYKLFARVKDKTPEYFVIEFKWEPPNINFHSILKIFGETPLPPYIKRQALPGDESTYQTIYAQKNGSVAAPTAGFHFTDEIFKKLVEKNIKTLYLTLHIGIATFKPVKSEIIAKHKMHSEYICFEKSLIKTLYNNLVNLGTDSYRKTIAVGTTSTRALESLYYLGTQISKLGVEKLQSKLFSFKINQWEPYETSVKISTKESLELILEVMEKESINKISGETEMIIVPGFQYKFIDGLITNFHLPKSTLLLLVSAFVGDKWREIYDYALENKFRFLSYGDGSLLFKE